MQSFPFRAKIFQPLQVHGIFLLKKEIVFGNVSVIGGGLVGVETAEYLAARGCNVTIIEMMDQIAKGRKQHDSPQL